MLWPEMGSLNRCVWVFAPPMVLAAAHYLDKRTRIRQVRDVCSPMRVKTEQAAKRNDLERAIEHDGGPDEASHIWITRMHLISSHRVVACVWKSCRA
ncbi:hypothetical protein K438DRAFT_1874212 [Mycena galopus ATCC 62051]|nr:hypothetical protein K438DRAFT_1874212 [Mycena galopus ATCC 62051]